MMERTRGAASTAVARPSRPHPHPHPPAERTTFVPFQGAPGVVVFTLPLGWSEELGWAPGCQLRVSRLDGGRLLVAEEGRRPTLPPVTIELSPEAPSEHLFRQLVSAYLAGTDEIVVHAPGRLAAGQLQVVREFVRRVSEFEVSFETKDGIRLRNATPWAASEPPALVHRMFASVLSLHREAGRSWTHRGPDGSAERLVHLDDHVDREAWLMERTLVRGLARGMYFGLTQAGAAEGLSYLMIAKTLERIADHAVRIGEEGRRLATGPPELLGSLTALHEQVMELLSAARALVERPDVELANELVDAVDRLLSGREAFGKSTLLFSRGRAARGALVLPTNLVLESLRRTASYVADLGELSMDLQANR